MTSSEKLLLAELHQHAVKRGSFQLSSGETSEHYIDTKQITLTGNGAHKVGLALYQRTRLIGVDAIGGPATGAIPLAVAAAVAYSDTGRLMKSFWVRDSRKKHGTQSMIEGPLQMGDKVVIVDDVVTTGKSALHAACVAIGLGCEVVKVIALVDREAGATELFKTYGIPYEPIFTLKQLLAGPPKSRSYPIRAKSNSWEVELDADKSISLEWPAGAAFFSLNESLRDLHSVLDCIDGKADYSVDIDTTNDVILLWENVCDKKTLLLRYNSVGVLLDFRITGQDLTDFRSCVRKIVDQLEAD